MKVDVSEPCSVDQFKSPGWLSAICGRVLAMELRFPLASRGLLSIFDQAIVSATSFFTAVLIGRTTSPEQLGNYYLVLSIILVISGVQEQIVSAPYLVYSKRRQGRELAEYAGSTWAHHFAISSLVVFGLLAAILGLSIYRHTDIVPGLWALAAFAPLILLRQGIRRFTFASLELKSAVVLDAAVAVLQLGGLMLLIYFGQLSLFGIFAVMGGACGIACAGWYLLNRPHIQLVSAQILPEFRRNWVFGKWALQTYLLAHMSPQLMLWIVSSAVGVAATGKFGACNNLIGLCNVILCGVDNVLTPQAALAFVTGGVNDLRRILIIAGSFLVLTMGSFCLFVLATGDWLVVFAFGADYHGTGLILLLLTLSTSISVISMLASNGLWAIDQPRSNVVADVVGMTVMLIVAALAVYPLGALGAALASLAGATSAAVVRSFTLIRCLERHAGQPSVAISPAAN